MLKEVESVIIGLYAIRSTRNIFNTDPFALIYFRKRIAVLDAEKRG